jgi:hypothetical protein
MVLHPVMRSSGPRLDRVILAAIWHVIPWQIASIDFQQTRSATDMKA